MSLADVARRILGEVHAGQRCRQMHVLPVLHGLCRPGDRMLDAGCGSGVYAYAIARAHPSVEVDGIDLNEREISRGQRRLSRRPLTNCRFWKSDLTTLDGDRRYQLILCTDVLEHIEDDEAVLRRFAALMAPEGKLVIHVPRAIQRRWFRRFEHRHQRDHVRDGYEPEQVRDVLNRSGFDPSMVWNTFGRPGALAWEVNTVFLESPILRWFYPVIHPLVAILIWFDVHLSHRSGNGLLIVARRSTADPGGLRCRRYP